MASSVECDRYGFFNGIYGLEQSNWAAFWRGIIPDGVLAVDDELKVYAQSDGRKVHVKVGQAIVAGHRCWVNMEKELDIAENSSGGSRTDGVFIRVTYGNSGASKMTVLVRTGVTSPAHTAGSIWELLLATVTVADGFVTVNDSDVKDKRFVFKLANDNTESITLSGSGTSRTGSVTPQNDRIFRASSSNALKKLTVYLPANPHATFITEVDFSSIDDDAYQGVTFYKEGTSTTVSVKVKGDKLTLKNRRYDLVIWYDGSTWFCASMAVA